MPFREWVDAEGMRAALLVLGVAAVLCPAGTAAASLLPPPPSLPTLPPPPDLTGAIGDLLGTTDVGTAPAGGGTPSDGSGGGTSATPSSGDATGSQSAAGTPTAPDTRAPRVTLKVLSGFAWVARTGRLKVRVSCDEQGVVAVGGSLRVRRRVLRLAASGVGYRSPGTVTATIRLPRAALRQLARARSVRLSLQAVAVDVAHNQRTAALKVTLARSRKVAHLRPALRSAGRRAVDTPG